ncbi:MAG TPA: hypothetical protein VFF91_06895 [Pseudoxanthomonas sp.]|nr:hypothetical protein [Pseudoxanthomonas sp.]
MTAPPPLRTGFVTVMARICLVLAGLGVAWALAQGVLGLLLPDAVVADLAARQALPPALVALLRHRHALAAVLLLSSLACLAASWGLLRRREWARQAFIVLLVAGAAVNFAGLAAVDHLFDALQAMIPAPLLHGPEGQQALAQLQASRRLAFLSSLAGALVLAVLHGWIAWKLCTPEVRAEFRRR